jgi:hypothetical protein
MKKFVCGLLMGIILTMGISAYAVPAIKSALFSPDIKLIVNGKTLDTQIVSVVKTGEVNMTNYVPARALSEALGATVTWDGKERVIEVSTESKETVTETTVESKSVSSINANLPEKVVVNGYEYVKPSEVLAALRARGYEMVNAVDPKYMQIVKDGEIIVKDIPSDARGGKFYIPYDFYEANILPLLQ